MVVVVYFMADFYVLTLSGRSFISPILISHVSCELCVNWAGIADWDL